MDYWHKSFGFYLSLGAGGVYFFFLAVFLLIDHFTVPKVLERLIARVKRLELKGFQQKEAKKLTVYRDERGQIVFIRHQAKKKDGEGNEVAVGDPSAEKAQDGVEVDKVVELKKGALDGNYEEKGKKKFADEANVAEAFLDGAGGKKKKVAKGPVGKAFKDEADFSSEIVAGAKKGSSNEEDTGPKEEEKESNGYFNEDGEWIEGENPYGEEEEKEIDYEAEAAKKRAENDLIEQQMQAKWEEEKEVIDFVK